MLNPLCHPGVPNVTTVNDLVTTLFLTTCEYYKERVCEGKFEVSSNLSEENEMMF